MAQASPDAPDVIVLTPGLSGSSVLTGLLARAGYWAGDETDTVGWETYENSRLVRLNRQILRDAGFQWHDVMDLPPPSEPALRNAGEESTLAPFVRACDENRPWIWKDPRLCYTIHAWGRHLELARCRFLVMSRRPWVTWTGIVHRSRRVISEKQFTNAYENCLDSAESFLRQRDIEPLRLTFEELIREPAASIEALNRFLGLGLEVDDLRAVYRGRLGQSRHSKSEYLGAKLRYLGKLLLGRVERLPRSPVA